MVHKILKIDAMGRITLPKEVRDNYSCVEFEETGDFWKLTPCENPEEDRYAVARAVLTELGYAVPEELQ